jgi:hypothetical protein
MHPYATDSNERQKTLLGLATGSILMSWFLHTIFQLINFSPPWWSDIPSFVGFYGIFYNLFDKWLWKLKLFRTIGLVKTPIISGKWDGYTVSSYDHHEKRTKATIEVFQTWTEMRVKLVTSTSISSSQTASLITGNADCATLMYDYINEPKPNAVRTMHSHRGMARHEYVIKKDYETLDGSYFTGRDRATFGALFFKKTSTH